MNVMIDKLNGRRIAWAALSLGGLVAALELILRCVIGLGNPPLTIADDRYEYRFKSDQNIVRFGNRIHINGWGMRSDHLPVKPSLGGRRILVFGDSVIFGGSQVDQSKIAVSVLQDRLRQVSPGVEVGNVSAGSWGPGNWKEWAAVYGFLGATDVLLVVSSHDALDNPTFAPLDPNTHPTELPDSAIGELLARYITPERVACQLRSWRLLPEKSIEVTPNPEKVTASTASITSQAAESHRGLADLTDFLRAAQRSGARVSVLQFWDRTEIQRGQPKPEHGAIKATIEKLRIPVYQSNIVFSACSTQPSYELFVDDIHPYTAAGQSCLGKAMLQALSAGGGLNDE